MTLQEIQELAGHRDVPPWVVKLVGDAVKKEREDCKKLCAWKTGNQFVDEAIAVCYRSIDLRGQT